MIPNATYIVLILKNIIVQSRVNFAYFVCWEYNISLKTVRLYKKKNYANIVCSNEAEIMQVKKYLVVILCKWKILDNKCTNIHTVLS